MKINEVKCNKCGHTQDAGSLSSPNRICEYCKSLIPCTKQIAFAILSIVTMLGADFLKMPGYFLFAVGILACYWVINALSWCNVKECNK